MSLSSGFFTSKNGDRKYSALDFGSIFDGVIEDGVFYTIGDRFAVTATSPASMKVQVKSGRGWFHHAWVYIDSPVTVTIPDSEVLLGRKDAVVIDIDHTDSARKVSLKVIKGTPAESPKAPSASAYASDKWHVQIPIAIVTVPAKATSVTSIRNIVSKTDENGPPWVTGPLQTVDTNEIYAHIEEQWNTFFYNVAIEQLNQINDLYSRVNADYNAFVANIASLTTSAQQTLAQFEQNIAQLRTSAEQRVNQLITDTTTRLNQLVADANNRINQLITDGTNRINQLITDGTNRINQLITDGNRRINELITIGNSKISQLIDECSKKFNQFLTKSDATFQKFMKDHNEGFNDFVDLKNNEFEGRMDDWNTSFSSFWTEFKQGMVEYLAAQEDIWETWFNHIQGQLSDDAATNLQRQIDALSFVYILAQRAVLGITASAIHERVVFGTYGSVADERIMITAPSRDTVWVFGDKAILSVTATVIHNMARFGTYGAVNDHRVVITAPSWQPVH